MKKHLLITTLLIACNILNAQNMLQFSHSLRSQKLLNPAYNRTGNDITLYALHRNQWTGIQGAPVIQGFNLQMPLVKDGLGIGITYTNSRWAFFNQNNVSASFAYSFGTYKNRFSAGIRIGANAYNIDKSGIVSNSTHIINNPKFVVPNVGFGFFYSREKFNAGFSIPEVMSYSTTGNNQPEFGSTFNIDRMPIYLFAGTEYIFNSDIAIEPYTYIRIVNKASQIDLYAHLKIKNTLKLGFGWKTNEAFVMYAGYKLKNILEIEYSYDYIVSSLSSLAKGVHEIGLLFYISKKRTPIHVIDGA